MTGTSTVPDPDAQAPPPRRSTIKRNLAEFTYWFLIGFWCTFLAGQLWR